MLLTQGCVAVSWETVWTEIDRQTETQTYNQTHRWTNRDKQTQTDGQTQTERWTEKERERDRHGGRSMDTSDVRF